MYILFLQRVDLYVTMFYPERLRGLKSRIVYILLTQITELKEGLLCGCMLIRRFGLVTTDGKENMIK
jgi:hypothetical protein